MWFEFFVFVLVVVGVQAGKELVLVKLLERVDHQMHEALRDLVLERLAHCTTQGKKKRSARP